MKKSLALALSLVLTAGLLGACTSDKKAKETKSSVAATTVATDKKVRGGGKVEVSAAPSKEEAKKSKEEQKESKESKAEATKTAESVKETKSAK